MDFLDRALSAHLAWKRRLGALLSGAGDALEGAPDAAAAQQCELGRWIYGAGA